MKTGSIHTRCRARQFAAGILGVMLASSSTILSAEIVATAENYNWFSYSVLNTTGAAPFTGAATTRGGRVIKLSGVAKVSNQSMTAKNIGYPQPFSNPSHPELEINPSIPLIVNSPELNGAISASYRVSLDSPLPKGSFLVLFDLDRREFAHVAGLGPDAYLDFVSPVGGPAGCSPNASFNAGEWTLTGTGKTTNGLVFFDAGGLAGFNLILGWTNKAGTIPAPNWDNGWAVAVPGPEPEESVQASKARQEIPAGTWQFNGNGFKGRLVLEVKSAGRNLVQLRGTVYGQPVVGTYDKRIRRINLQRMIRPNDPSTFQWIIGYLFTNKHEGKVTHTMAGTFGPFGPGGTANDMLEAGWVAEMEQGTQGPAGSFAYDGFDGSLALDWKFLHPEKSHVSLARKPGALTIRTQQGGMHWDATGVKNLVVIDNPVAGGGDFTMTTCLDSFRPVANWQQAGLLCYDDEDNYIKWVYEVGNATRGRQLTMIAEEGGTPVTRQCRPFRIDPERLWLRLTKRGDRYAVAFSTDGNRFEWQRDFGWRDAAPKMLGLNANNGPRSGAPEIDASFDFFEVRAPEASELVPRPAERREARPRKADPFTASAETIDPEGRRRSPGRPPA